MSNVHKQLVLHSRHTTKVLYLELTSFVLAWIEISLVTQMRPSYVYANRPHQAFASCGGRGS